MYVCRIDQQPNALAPVRRRLAAVDPGHDLLSGDQLVLRDTRESAVDERIGPQLLHDADIDREITNICRCGTFQQVRAAIHAAANA